MQKLKKNAYIEKLTLKNVKSQEQISRKKIFFKGKDYTDCKRIPTIYKESTNTKEMCKVNK